MKFNISGFSHEGTVRETNQDRILANGHLLNKGEVNLVDQDHCICFVADGVGGNNAGEFASQFVLESLKIETGFYTFEIDDVVQKINKNLLEISRITDRLSGAATTLTGIVIKNETYKFIHAGDSQMWLLRNDMFFKITNDQIFNDNEKNSPVTSYFGGSGNYLKFDNKISISQLSEDDLLLICSDGLFKSLDLKKIKSILKSDIDLKAKSKILLENCLLSGAEDNISVILINQVN